MSGTSSQPLTIASMVDDQHHAHKTATRQDAAIAIPLGGMRSYPFGPHQNISPVLSTVASLHQSCSLAHANVIFTIRLPQLDGMG